MIRGGAIGDFILTLPTIRLLREGLPNPHIEVLGYPGITSLATLAGFADGLRSIEHGALAPFFAPGATLDPGLCEYFQSFQLVLSYLYDPDGFFAANLEKAGVKTLLKGTHRMDEIGGVPAALQLSQPLQEIALYLDQPWVSLGLPRPAPPGPILAFHPGSGSPRKNWGYERWADLASRLNAESYLVISGEAERDTIADLLSQLRSRNLTFQHLEGLPLTEVARALSGCKLYLGHDSGISHLAAACDLPSVLLFGQTDPAIWAPQNPGVRVLRAPGGQLAALPPATVAEVVRTLL
ncbi:MAG: ADP-heptose:LPS heptosyltransferase/ADP-heptose:LPS heptosyltransferase [Verrucomicrobia bacterium]|nr:MAG: ADP-heptose:LPS heptosyltransferase/ADP-heptose:LPS heptosyltransferase [Verrucomicrobiota bacterium]